MGVVLLNPFCCMFERRAKVAWQLISCLVAHGRIDFDGRRIETVESLREGTNRNIALCANCLQNLCHRGIDRQIAGRIQCELGREIGRVANVNLTHPEMVEAATRPSSVVSSSTQVAVGPCEATAVTEHGPEIATLRTMLDDLQRRVVALIADPTMPQESSLVAELYSVERLLIGAGRALARADVLATN